MIRPFHVFVLAAGRGTRMRSAHPKVLFDVCGRPALGHVVDLAHRLSARSTTIVVSPESAEACEASVGGRTVRVVVQDPPRGTGHATRVAFEAIDTPTDDEDVLVLYGDGPLYTDGTVRELLERHAAGGAEVAATLLTAELDDPHGYGRVVRSADGGVDRIVEELDADAAVRAIREVNTGLLVLRAATGRAVVEGLGSKNAKGEVYLTDAIAALRTKGARVGRVPLRDLREGHAFNSIAELATVRDLMRRRIVEGHQANGVDVVDPATTWIDVDVIIGAGTRILPFTVLGRGARIGRDCVVGPFAHLRPSAALADGVEVGGFVEVPQHEEGSP